MKEKRITIKVDVKAAENMTPEQVDALYIKIRSQEAALRGAALALYGEEVAVLTSVQGTLDQFTGVMTAKAFAGGKGE